MKQTAVQKHYVISVKELLDHFGIPYTCSEDSAASSVRIDGFGPTFAYGEFFGKLEIGITVRDFVEE